VDKALVADFLILFLKKKIKKLTITLCFPIQINATIVVFIQFKYFSEQIIAEKEERESHLNILLNKFKLEKRRRHICFLKNKNKNKIVK
jgi:hypothetical protein